MAFLFEAFLLGLSTGPICLAYCAPVLAPLIVSVDGPQGFSRTTRLLGLFLVGRLAGYLCVGLVAGVVGSRLFTPGSGPVWVVTLSMGVALLVFGLMKNFPRMKLCTLWPAGRASTGWGIVLGFLTGLSICPPFVAAITSSTTLGAVHSSVLYFVAFFVGTAVYIPPMILLGPLSAKVPFNQVAKGCLLLSGAWFVYRGVMEGLVSASL
jgi:sulfite exporter TauE/SafE